MALSSLFFLSVFLHHLIISFLPPEAFSPHLTQVNPMEPTLTLHDTVLILLMLYWPRMLFPLSPKGSFLYSPLSSYIVSFKRLPLWRFTLFLSVLVTDSPIPLSSALWYWVWLFHWASSLHGPLPCLIFQKLELECLFCCPIAVW